MTDSDIIKALECCVGEKRRQCSKCPCDRYGSKTLAECRGILLGHALDLGKRQQAEIERLKAEKDNRPLTKDELMQMVGQPVWTVGVSHTKDNTWAMWDIIEKADDGGIEFGYSTEIVGWYNYGIAWMCNRAKPEVVSEMEGENGRA